MWEDGPILRDLAARKAALQKAREEVDAARKVSVAAKSSSSNSSIAVCALTCCMIPEFLLIATD